MNSLRRTVLIGALCAIALGASKGVDYLHRGERNVRPLYGEKP
jgi:hypothetical protein